MTEVHTDQRDFTLSQLREDVDANDIVTDPDYQRKYVYDDKRASKLVESILIGIPIPTIYLCEEIDGRLSVIDGQQRIVSFVRFLKNEFALSDLIQLRDLNGQYYRDMDKASQRTLKQKSLHAIVIKKDSQDLKYEIFSRLNLGAVKLKDQEVRNCIYRGSFNNMLKDIASKNKTLQCLFHDDNKRSAYEERILRFFAMRDFMNIQGTYKKVMNAYMEAHQNDDEASILKFTNQYNSLIDTIKTVLGEDAFFALSEKRRKKFNGAIYDSIIIAFSYFNKRSLIENADKIRDAINNIKANDETYLQDTYVGTNAGIRVRRRIQCIMDVINKITMPTPAHNSPRCFDPSIKEELYFPGYICSYCHNTILSIDDCEIDHIVPFSKGGSTDIENAQLLHRSCNRSKGDRLPVGELIDDLVDDNETDS